MILPPQVSHTDPVRDSRGLVYDGGWRRDGATLTLAGGYVPEDAPEAASLIRIAGNYLAAPDHKPTAPCHVCETEQPVVMTLLSAPVYAICPEQDNPACIERGLAKRAAERAQAAEQAPEPEALAAPGKATSPVRPKRRSRPSQARTLLSQKAPKNAAEPPAEPAPGGSADPAPGGAA